MSWQTAALRVILLACLLGLLLPPPPAVADPLEEPPADGRFFRLPTGADDENTLLFSVIDDREARFWSEFERLGGLEGVGYPISQRFIWDGFPTQAFQKMVLQWRAGDGRVTAVNVVDLLHERGLDGWLLTERATPLPADWSSDAGLAWPDVMAAHLELLTDPDIRASYFAVEDPVTVYGLPMAPIQDQGNVLVLRAQRGILQKWLVDVPWAKVGQVTVANSGDLAKESGLLPESALASVEPMTLLSLDATPAPATGAEPRSADLPSQRVAPSHADGRRWRVVLDPGHGGPETGSVRKFANGAVLAEKSANLQIALRTAELLRAAGVDVRLTRDTDRQVNDPAVDRNGDGKASLADDLQTRVLIANDFAADVFVSIHNNGHADRSASGTEVYYSAVRPHSGPNKTLANSLNRRIVESIRRAGYPVRDRGIRTDASVSRGGSFAVLGPASARIPQPSRMPAALSESLFVTNDVDGAWLAKPEMLAAIAAGHAEGIIDFFEWLEQNG